MGGLSGAEVWVHSVISLLSEFKSSEVWGGGGGAASCADTDITLWGGLSAVLGVAMDVTALAPENGPLHH